MMSTFVRLTLGVAIALLAFFVLAFVLKLVVVAAVVAAIVLGTLLAVNFVRALIRGPRARLTSGDVSRMP